MDDLTKKRSRIIACVMLAAAAVFFIIALNNPQAGFPWSNSVTYAVYLAYIAIMVILFAAPFRRNK